MFIYRIYNGEVRVLACRSRDPVIHVPEAIEGYPVTELAAYAFSQGRGRKAMLQAEGVEISEEELCGDHLEELFLPSTLRKIGNYAFYHCYKLHVFHCFSSIMDVGAGLFTGCAGIRNINLTVVDGMKSCFKELLSELRQELYVTYVSPKGKAKLIFPEMYEESVENTPARFIMREMHGCGHLYRYCFEQTDFQFQRYDGLFLHARVQESEQLSAALAAGRLRYPLGLHENHEKEYTAYIRKHFLAAASWFLSQKDEEGLVWLAEHYIDSSDQADALIDLCNSLKDTEGLSYLMDYKHRNYTAQRRKFFL